MAASQPFVLRWGIIATGRISMDFTLDTRYDPATRGTHDVAHKVVAVGSRSVESAQTFIDAHADGDKSIKPYGSYEGVFADKDVDAVYIGTPHTKHYENARDAIIAGKHVLCEKATTSNAPELKALLKLAKEHKVFFMEAMWTRFHPFSHEIKQVAEDGQLGDPIILQADLSSNFHPENLPLTHRMMDPHLGGGALLDLGPYPMFWVILIFYEHPSNKKARPTSVSASIVKGETGVDYHSSWTVNFTETLKGQAILSSSMTIPPPPVPATIRYKNGRIILEGPLYRPTGYTVQYFKPGTDFVEREVTKRTSYGRGGWYYEADEVARCVRDGKLESDLWGHDKSIILMETFDEVRRQGNYKFPQGVEKVL